MAFAVGRSVDGSLGQVYCAAYPFQVTTRTGPGSYIDNGRIGDKPFKVNFAEAKAELGTIDQADIDKSIKILRDRVGMPNLILSAITVDPDWDFPTLSPIINEVRRERRVELAAEGFRFDDIMRWAAADELIVGKRPHGFKASQLSVNPYPVDANGFLDPYQEKLPSGYGFKIGRDYLNAIPKDQLLLNPALVQNPGWN